MSVDTFTLLTGWTSWLVAALAICPALVVWRAYAPLMKRLDDPVLPERLASRRVVTAAITVGGIAIVVSTLIVAERLVDAVWAVPLLLLARLRVTYGIRRILLGENLTFSSYVLWVVRFMLAASGLFLLLAFAPILVVVAGDYGPLVALVLGLVMVLWTWRSSDVLLFLLRATPLEREREDLQPRFAAIVDKTNLAPPRVWQTGDAGAVFANAFALPSLRGASVLFTRTLLERLDAEEIAAVYGHEIAHLEYFTPTRLRRIFLLTLLQAVGAALIVPAVAALGDETLDAIVMVAWPLFVVVTLLLRASHVHANEFASDRRGVELCGTPEALASGLSKLYAISRLPARWEARSKTHPSLARRLRAIRESVGQPAAPLGEPVVIDGAAADACLLFEPTTLRYVTGVPADTPRDPASVIARAADVRSFAYDEIRTCRVVARGLKAPELLVIDRRKRRITAPLRDVDIPRIQHLLDAIEPQIAEQPPAAALDNRFIALLLLTIAMLPAMLWSVFLASVLVLLKPATDLLAAAIAMLIASGLFALITPTANGSAEQMPALLTAAGVLLLVLVLLPRWRSRMAPVDLPRWSLAAIPLAALASWLLVMLQWDGRLLRLVQALRESPALAALPVGAAVLCMTRLRARIGVRVALAGACAIAAIVPGLMSTMAFQDRIVRDPLLVDMPELLRVPAKLTPVAYAQLQQSGTIRVSPDAGSIASGWSESEDEDDEGTPTVFAVRTADGRIERIAASDLQFLDNERVLVLRQVREGEGLELALHTLGQVTTLNASANAGANATASVNAGAGAVAPSAAGSGLGPAAVAGSDTRDALVQQAQAIVASPKRQRPASRSARGAAQNAQPDVQAAPWTLRLPDFSHGRLSIDPRTGRWRVAGQNRDGDWVRVQGVLGNEIVDEARWRSDARRAERVLFESGRAIVSFRHNWSPSLLGRLAPRLAMVIASMPSSDVTLQRVEDLRITPLVDSQADVECLEAEVNAGMAACLAYDGIDTRIWSIDAEHSALLPIGKLRGRARPLARGLDGSILVWWKRHPVIVHLRSPRAIELTTDSLAARHWRGGAYTSMSGHLVVVSDIDPDVPAITTYRFALDERVIAGGPPARAAADRVMLDGR